MRASEATQLQWSQVDLHNQTLHVHRLKNGNAAGHPLQAETVEALKTLEAEQPDQAFVFVSERGTALDRINLGRIVRRAGAVAEIPFPVHPHMLRHATGYYLANSGQELRVIQDYLGHRNVQHTVLYTQLAPNRFRSLWS